MLTDFGSEDVYVGVMKGAIATFAPQVRVIDLTHAIAPGDVKAAGFCLEMAFSYFPPGTVYLAVVDPGVGTARRAIAIETESALLVGPDNGLFMPVLERTSALLAVELTEREYWRTRSPGPTFHGRDIFAPVAAHLAAGLPIEALGKPFDPHTLVRSPGDRWVVYGSGVRGHIQYIDRFGNLITTIPGEAVSSRSWQLATGTWTLPGRRTYADVPPGEPLALIGSHGYIEIAVNSGSAHLHLGLPTGYPATVNFLD